MKFISVIPALPRPSACPPRRTERRRERDPDREVDWNESGASLKFLRFKLPLFLAAGGILFSGCRPAVEPYSPTVAPGETVYFVPNSRKMVALTFDDGPNGAATEKILEALKKHNVKATFFLIGANVERFPQITRRIAAEGHLIGVHTYQHPRYDQISPAAREKDIADASQAIETAAGIRPRWFRPPFGINGAELAEVCRRQDLILAGWSLDANDWNPHPLADLVKAIVEQATAGDIILLHDGQDTRPDADRAATVAAVPIIVDELKAQGFVFVTLPELLRQAGAPLAVFENGIRLLGMHIPSQPVYAGDAFWARYLWDVPAGCPVNPPRAFVHFLKPGGQKIFQDDHALPARGDVRDLVARNIVRLPRNLPPGKYELRLGLFDPARPEKESRLKVKSNFSQARRALCLPAVLEVAPAPEKKE